MWLASRRCQQRDCMASNGGNQTNCKKFEGNPSWRNCNWRRQRNTSVSVACIPVEIRTESLSNTNRGRSAITAPVPSCLLCHLAAYASFCSTVKTEAFYNCLALRRRFFTGLDGRCFPGELYYAVFFSQHIFHEILAPGSMFCVACVSASGSITFITDVEPRIPSLWAPFIWPTNPSLVAAVMTTCRHYGHNIKLCVKWAH